MASVFDVANWLLHFGGEMTAWKLQKLVYYGQAWSLVWDERPLFPEPIQAWANGPVCPDLYQRHRGQFMVHNIDGGNWQNIDADGAETLKAVLDYYGKRSAQELSDLTHMERPWAETRGGLPPGANCTREISHALMAEYYESLPPGT